jgi:hypothetical protein
MKKLDEIQNYLKDKREIYNQIVLAIEESLEKGETRILLKQITLMDTTVDAFANKEEWPNCLEKARNFFESMEDYESCQRCKNLLSKISKNAK